MAISLQGQAFEFFQHIQQAWQSNTLQRLILSQYQGEKANMQKLMIRSIKLKDELQLQVVYRYQTKDITKNYTWQEFESLSSDWLMQFKQSNLFTDQAEFQLKIKKQQWQLTQTQIKTAKHTASNPQENINIAKQHNRQKQRWIEQDRQFLQLLGVTDQKHQIIPSMSRKWKQINKFVEIFAGAVNQAGFTMLVYGLSMVLLFSASTLYHGATTMEHRAWLKKLDHTAIYYLIAGTYTPFLALYIPTPKAKTLLVALWSIAFLGTLFKLYFIERFSQHIVITITHTWGHILYGWYNFLCHEKIYLHPCHLALVCHSWGVGAFLCNLGDVVRHFEKSAKK